MAAARPNRPRSDALRLLPPSINHQWQAGLQKLLVQGFWAARDYRGAGGGGGAGNGGRGVVAGAPPLAAATGYTQKKLST